MVIHFEYDKDYANLAQANDEASNDGILLNRFILIKYSNKVFSYDEKQTIIHNAENLTDAEEQQWYDNYLQDNSFDYDRYLCRKQWDKDKKKFFYEPIVCFVTDISAEAVRESWNEAAKSATAAAGSAAEANASADSASVSASRAADILGTSSDQTTENTVYGQANFVQTKAYEVAKAAEAAQGSKEDAETAARQAAANAQDALDEYIPGAIDGYLAANGILTWKTY